MFGISAPELIVLAAVAAVVLGPERLPEYAASLARLVRELRRMAQGATEQVKAEMGPEFEDIDWAKLDPRQYDPRRIVREALTDVWDPDDPLGLKDEKPVSPGGPGDVGARAAAGGAEAMQQGEQDDRLAEARARQARLRAEQSGGVKVDGAPDYDPDAT